MRTSLFLLLTLAMLGTGCASSSSLPAIADSGLVGPSWQLSTVRGDAPGGPGASMTFGADGTLGGSAGCNRLTGTFALESGGRITLSPLGTTRMACPAPAAEQERLVLAALADVDRYAVQGDGLVLMSASGERLLAFESAGAAEAGKGAITGRITYLPRIALPPDAVVTLGLLDVSRADALSETLSEIEFAVEGRQVPLPFIIRYDRADVDEGRRYVLRAQIRDAAGALLWTTDSAVPVITNGAPSGAVEVRVTQVTGGSAAAAPLAGTAWRLAEIKRAGGLTIDLDPSDAYTLRFGADGRYSGQADCNSYGGEYAAQAGGALELERGLTTLAACPPGSASDDFFAVLAGVDRYEQSGGRLVLHGSDGSSLVFQ